MTAIVPSKIAVIFDCDDTLAPDTSTWLLRQFGIDPTEFWPEAGRLVADGWDAPLAYMTMLARETQPGKRMEGLTRERLKELGPAVPFYPGVPEFFGRLRAEVESKQEYRDVGIQVEFYVISGGIEDLLLHTRVAPCVRDLWGCGFLFDEGGHVTGVKRVVSFTEKTRYLFQVHKGLIGPDYKKNPYVVNRMVPIPRPVPIQNMVYVGDGPSDVPCMSVLHQYGGAVIGILCDETPKRAFELGLGRRASVTVPADFGEASQAYKQLKIVVADIADRIILQHKYGEQISWKPR